MSSPGDRRGFGFIELMVILVLGTFVLMAVYQLLITNQRTYAVQNAQARSQQTLRAGLSVLASELREISPRDGDIVAMTDNSIRIRASRGLGLVCGITTTGIHPTVLAKRVGNYLQSDSGRVFYENHPSRLGDDDWRTARLDVVDSTGVLTCPDGSVAQTVILRGVEWGNRPDSVTIGAPVRAFRHYRYHLGTSGGEGYLVQVDAGGNASALVGPLDPDNGLELTYRDSLGAVTAVPAEVHEIEIVLRTAPRRTGNQAELGQDSLKTRIYTRNTN